MIINYNNMNLTKEEIIQGNILIALFLGWKIDNTFPDKNRVYRSPKNSIELDTTFSFHKSYDLLMPIVKMIDEWGKYTFEKEGSNSYYEPTHLNPAIMNLTSLWILVVHEIGIINSWNNRK